MNQSSLNCLKRAALPEFNLRIIRLKSLLTTKVFFTEPLTFISSRKTVIANALEERSEGFARGLIRIEPSPRSPDGNAFLKPSIVKSARPPISRDLFPSATAISLPRRWTLKEQADKRERAIFFLLEFLVPKVPLRETLISHDFAESLTVSLPPLSMWQNICSRTENFLQQNCIV